MKLSDFDYDLPQHLIAQKPAAVRDQSRMMVLTRSNAGIAAHPQTPQSSFADLEHSRFAELPKYLNSGDCLVVNDTRVFPARVYGVREGHTGQVELLLTRSLETGVYEAMTKPAKKLTPGTRLRLGESGAGAVIEREVQNGRRVVRFDADVDPAEFLDREGHLPLPPYIQRPDGPADRERYQTVFSDQLGAVAAPTAGLHFTDELIHGLLQKGVIIARVTLHVGPGTFVPVTAEDPRDHKMEPEWYRLGGLDAQVINRALDHGSKVVAVGTTSVRTLETVAFESNRGWRVAPGEGWTNAFIFPPYEFKVVQGLITNFHLPKSSLLLLVSAFAGESAVRRAYQEAIAEEYRFYSYGDGMLIL